MARPLPQDTIVQFSAHVYFVEESEAQLKLDLIRLGRRDRASTVRYSTFDGSAKAGTKYEHTEGSATFREGEYMLPICVPIVQNELWSPTLEFKVRLTDPEGCILPCEATTCRVKIIDDDAFPSNKYRHLLKKGVDAIPQWGLFVEYVKLNMSAPGIKAKTIATISFDQLHNLYLFFLLTARTYLINVVFNENESSTQDRLITLSLASSSEMERRVSAAQLVALMYVLPLLCLHMWDYMSLKLDIEGHSRVFLQACLFRKYLNFTEQSRSQVRVSHMQVALLSNTADLAKCYTSVLEMVKMLGKLVLLMLFMLTQDSSVAWVLVAMPGLMLAFGYMRSNALSKASEMAGPLKKEIIDITTETCEKYRLIADYMQRPQMNEIFAGRSEELRRSLIPERQVELNNSYFTRWVGPAFNAAYICFAAELVLSKKLTLGVFLATLSVFSEVSGDFSSLYAHIMDVNSRLDALKTLTKYFNMETEVSTLKALNRKRREATKDAWAEALQKPMPAEELGLFKTDLISIRLQNVCFRYGNHSSQTLKNEFEINNINLDVPQGKLVAVVGPHGSGKGTFLRLLAQTLFPTAGTISIPMHLRVLFVSQLPVLFDQDPWYNIVFGRPDFDDPDILEALLREFEMDATLNMIAPELRRRRARRSQEPRQARDTGSPSSQRAPAPHSTAMQAQPFLQKSSGNRAPYMEMRESKVSGCSGSFADESDTEISESSDEEQGLLTGCCSAALCGEPDPEIILQTHGRGWQDKLSHTELVKIHLLRALVTNPEVLVLHRPFHNYDVYTQKRVLDLLRQHQENRGLGLPMATWKHRRPRTIFFTPESLDQARVADVIWQIDSDSKSVVQISAEQLQEGFVFNERGKAAHLRTSRQQWQSQAIQDYSQRVLSLRAPSVSGSPLARLG